MKEHLWIIALTLASGCAAGRADDPRRAGADDEDVPRIVTKEKAPIPSIKFGGWFLPSGWATRLATRWAELPHAFDAQGPQYCAVLGVDRDRMLHASVPVRFHDDKQARTGCPTLVWKAEDRVTGLGVAHNKPHGERISSDDAAWGNPVSVMFGRHMAMERSPIAMNFFSGELLVGVDPATGQHAAVPAQSLLFTRVGGVLRVFMWTRLASGTEDKHSVAVYKPAPNDGWDEVGMCWVDREEMRQRDPHQPAPPAHCDPDDLWLK